MLFIRVLLPRYPPFLLHIPSSILSFHIRVHHPLPSSPLSPSPTYLTSLSPSSSSVAGFLSSSRLSLSYLYSSSSLITSCLPSAANLEPTFLNRARREQRETASCDSKRVRAEQRSQTRSSEGQAEQEAVGAVSKRRERQLKSDARVHSNATPSLMPTTSAPPPQRPASPDFELPPAPPLRCAPTPRTPP